MDIEKSAIAAKAASIKLAACEPDTKKLALENIARALDAGRAKIVAANQLDLQASRENDLPAPLLKRLKFDSGKIDTVIEGVQSLMRLPEPVGVIQSALELDDGLELYRVSCPIGVGVKA